MANRVSTYTTGSGEPDGRNGEQKRNLWQSMLESVASGKRLPEKNILVLGMAIAGPETRGQRSSS
jgi:dynein light intermediate chain 1